MKLILKDLRIFKYKSFQSEQSVPIEESVTTLVGKNESGKSAFLEALAKFNYFENDIRFRYDETPDYPRNELKKYQRSGENSNVVRCTFEMDMELVDHIKSIVGENALTVNSVGIIKDYSNEYQWVTLGLNEKSFIEFFFAKYNSTKETMSELKTMKTLKELIDLAKTTTNEQIKTVFQQIKTEIIDKANNWNNLLDGFVVKTILSPLIPKFWYFSEYFTLPSRININKLKDKVTDTELSSDSLKTSLALFELANINIDELIQSQNYESFITELEATSNEITDQIFKYWTTNKNLDIKFTIDNVKIPQNPNNYHKILDIRVWNNKYRISLPLQNRSKGFNWFFSFIVWFSKIQFNGDKNFILLLDEPGLNLHASAQADLLKYIEDLSKEYQIIYTTHSPFMIDSEHLERVRTVLDSENGSIISNAIQEKDPDTLFPLQAALGYDISQNLFISKNNLLVEGPADLLFLTILSNYLETKGKTGLKPGITIVPIGGMDKVVSFISLLKGNNLNIVTLLDSFTDIKGKQRLEDLIKYKIIKEKNVRFFDEFISTANKQADIEDLFEKKEYVELFNKAFTEYPDFTVNKLDPNTPNILKQICKIIKKDRFNHYRPAYYLAQITNYEHLFSNDTLIRFENLFKEINQLF